MTVEELKEQYLVVPEVVIYKTLQSILKFLRKDVENATTTVLQEDSYLYKLCGLMTTADGRYNYYQQARKVFTPKIDDPKFLELHMSYNQQLAKPNSICISHSGEAQHGMNGIGLDTNFHKEDGEFYEDGQRSNTYTRRFQATYTLYITGDNSNEVVLIYQIIKSLLISFTQHLTMFGLANLKLGGQDILFKQEAMPKLHTKALTMGFEYDSHSIDIHKDTPIQNIIFQGIMKDI